MLNFPQLFSLQCTICYDYRNVYKHIGKKTEKNRDQQHE